MLRRACLGIGVYILCVSSAMAEGPHFATGIKIGEVDNSSAVVWARLTRDAERVPMGAPLPIIAYRDPVSHVAHPAPRCRRGW